MHVRQPRGFTLIELLVVISIVALLMAILLPVLGTARAAAKQVVCLSNMRQLGIATNSYMGHHKGYYPQPSTDSNIPDSSGSTTSAAADALQTSANWFNALDYYLAQDTKDYTTDRNYNAFKQDPSWKDLPEGPILGLGNDQTDVRTIRMNEWFGYINISDNPNETYRFFRELEIETPISKTVMFADGRAHDTPAPNTGVIDVSAAGHFYIDELRVGLRHDKGVNVTFADGHAAHHRNEIRTSTGANQYQGWYVGDAATNGYNGAAAGTGPHELYWRFGRDLY